MSALCFISKIKSDKCCSSSKKYLIKFPLEPILIAFFKFIIASRLSFDLIKIFESAFKYVRQKNLPFCQIVHTHRLAAHSKGDDTRSKEELEELSGHDPLVILGDQLDQKTVKNIDKEAELSVSKVFDKFENEILIWAIWVLWENYR